ncbi:hypothetical protein PIB30_078029 [Stylosanthes scabra]|uniref:GRF-type domain-containing protein n=1 Tax=Stylosanthes scabra TaxID=79078 RepID=A0ABU6WP13_9FABA|nr:hypothetical protein [Stylosanthes scabra]
MGPNAPSLLLAPYLSNMANSTMASISTLVLLVFRAQSLVGANQARVEGACVWPCGHGERPVLRVYGTKENPGRRFWGFVYYEVKDECNFFRWVDPELEHGDHEVGKLRKKVGSLKMKVKAAELKMKVAVVGALVGWVGMFSVWVYSSSMMSPSFVRAGAVSDGLGGL